MAPRKKRIRTNDPTTGEIITKSGGRKGTQCTHLIDKRARGEKTKIEFDMKLEPIGEAAKHWISYLGLQGRSKVNIARFDEWPDVDTDLKENLWRDVLETFEFKPSPDLKKKWISYMGDRWRGFKSSLNRFIFGDDKDINPCDIYSFLHKDTWDEFKKYRLSEEFQIKRAAAKESQSLNPYVHTMSRGGYKGLGQKMYNEKWEKLIKAAMDDGGMSEEEARSTIPPPSPIRRHETFKEGHKKNGQYTTEAAQIVGEKIDSLKQQESQGQFVESGRYDILRSAIGKDEHPGRVRGSGRRTCIKQFFGPSTSKQRGPQEDHAQCRDMMEHMQAMVLNLYSTLGVQPPNDLPVMKIPFTSTQISNTNPSVQSPLIRSATRIRKQRVMSKDPFLHKEVVAREEDMVENNPKSSLSEEPDPIGDFDDGTKCRLFVTDPQRHVVAHGKMYNFSKNHGVELTKGKVKVTIDEVMDAEALLPYPDDDANKVGEGEGHFLVWPKKLIEITIDHEEEGSRLMEMKEITKEVGSNKTKEPKILIASSEIDKLPIIDTKSLYGASRDLFNILKLMPIDREITCRMDQKVVGEEYDFFLCKKHMLELLALNELHESCIQIWLKTVHHMCLVRKHSWIGLLCPVFIQNMGDEEKRKVDYVAKTMIEGKKTIYLAPFFVSKHWMLCVIKPKENVSYWFDPSWQGPHKDLESLVGKAMSVYQMSLGKRPQRRKQLNWKVMHYHKQERNTDCGYYVMAYMKEILEMESDNIDFTLHFMEVRDPYSKKEIDSVRDLWASYFINTELDNV